MKRTEGTAKGCNAMKEDGAMLFRGGEDGHEEDGGDDGGEDGAMLFRGAEEGHEEDGGDSQKL